MYALADHLDQSARPRLSPLGLGTVILLQFGQVRLNVMEGHRVSLLRKRSLDDV